MKKNVIRLNESHLRGMISESVRRVLKEYSDYDSYLAHLEAENEPKEDVVMDPAEFMADAIEQAQDKLEAIREFAENLKKDAWAMRKYQKDIAYYLQSVKKEIGDEEWASHAQTGDFLVDGLMNLAESGELYDFFKEVFYPNDLGDMVREWYDAPVFNDGPDY